MFNGKTYQQLIERAKQHIGKVRSRRKAWEVRSYVNMMMAQGNHWVNDKGLVDIRDPNQLRRTVNKFRSTLRALKNSITYNAPIVDVLPGRGQEDIDQRDLDTASYVCTGEFEKNHLKDKMKTLIDDAACKTFAIMSILPNDDDDADADDCIVYFNVHDPLDVFFDYVDMQKAQMVVVSSAETKRFLQSSGYMNLNKVQVSNDKSHTALKSEFERLEGGGADQSWYLIDQVFMLDYDETAAGEIKLDKKTGKPASEPKLITFTYCGDTMIKEPEELTGYDDLSDIFKVYYMEKNDHITYSNPWMSDAVPLQRSLDDASENTDTIMHWFCKVRLLQSKDDGNTVQVIEDGHVQKISYQGNKPEFMDIPNVPESLFKQTEVRESQIEDMVGMHSASMGKLVSAGASGRLQALAQASDMDNISEPTSNLQTFLEDVFKRVLDIASDNVRQVTKFYGSSHDDSVLAIGEDAFDKLSATEQQGVRPIKKFHNVKVQVIPGSAFSVMQEKQELLEMMPILVNAGMKEEAEAMFDVLMRMYATGGIRDISKALETKTRQMEEENADVKIAEFEQVKLAKGEPVTATPEQDHDVHIAIHTASLQAIGKKYGAQSDVAHSIVKHIMQHESLKNNPPTQLPPGGAPPGAGMGGGAQPNQPPLMPADQAPAPVTPLPPAG